jgi:hypothetical protein
MRLPRMRFLVGVPLVSFVALAVLGAAWVFSFRTVQDAADLQPVDLKRRLDDYRKQIVFHAREESWALAEADQKALATAGGRKQLEHVRQFGGPPLWEYWAREIDQTSREAAASRKKAAEHGRRRLELEDAYYRMWKSVPSEMWESIRVSPRNEP